MRKRWRLFLVLVLLLLVGGLLLFPQVRWVIHGWLHGEAFYQGMPTSWWEMKLYERFVPRVESVGKWDLPKVMRDFMGPWALNDASVPKGLIDGDPRAEPVLLALLKSQIWQVRSLAISGLISQGKGKPGVIGALTEAINDREGKVRSYAIAALNHLDPAAAAKAGVKYPD